MTFTRFRRDEGGFTLIEFLVIVLILGILTFIFLPLLSSGDKKSAKPQRASSRTNAAVTSSKPAPYSVSCTGRVCDLKLPTGPREKLAKRAGVTIKKLQLDGVIAKTCKAGKVTNITPVVLEAERRENYGSGGLWGASVTTDLLFTCLIDPEAAYAK